MFLRSKKRKLRSGFELWTTSPDPDGTTPKKAKFKKNTQTFIDHAMKEEEHDKEVGDRDNKHRLEYEKWKECMWMVLRDYLSVSNDQMEALELTMRQNDAVVSGSFPLRVFLSTETNPKFEANSWKPYDVDIFQRASDESDMKRKIKTWVNLFASFKEWEQDERPVTLGDKHCYSLDNETVGLNANSCMTTFVRFEDKNDQKCYNKTVVQIVTYIPEEQNVSLQDIITHRFDLDVCTLMWPEYKKQSVAKHNDVVACNIRDRKAQYLPHVRQKNAGDRFKERYRKYCDRGFIILNAVSSILDKHEPFVHQIGDLGPLEARRQTELDLVLHTLLDKHASLIEKYRDLVRGDALNRGYWVHLPDIVDQLRSLVPANIRRELAGTVLSLSDEKCPELVRLMWEFCQMWQAPSQGEQNQLMHLCFQMDVGPVVTSFAGKHVPSTDLYGLFRSGAHKGLEPLRHQNRCGSCSVQ